MKAGELWNIKFVEKINNSFILLPLKLRNQVRCWFQNAYYIIAHVSEVKCLKQNE